eukprot:m.201232 g.201232  ORF g.201232 m.201232 type:complete len:1967 (-) comp32794_c0_seq3:42-5942(-)
MTTSGPKNSPLSSVTTSSSSSSVTPSFNKIWKSLQHETSFPKMVHDSNVYAQICIGPAMFTQASSSSNSKTTLSSIKDERTKHFVVELAKVLELDDFQAFQLFQNYFTEADLEVWTKDLKGFLVRTFEDDKLKDDLLNKIKDFYYEERLHSLGCQKELLAHYIADAKKMPTDDTSWAGLKALASHTKKLFFSSPLEKKLKDALNRQPAPKVKQKRNAPTSLLYADLGIKASKTQKSPLGTQSSTATATTTSNAPSLSTDQRVKLAIQVLKERKECLLIMLLYKQIVFPTGNTPFDSDDQLNVIKMIKSGPDPFPNTLYSGDLTNSCIQTLKDFITLISFLQVVLCFQVTVFYQMDKFASNQDALDKYFEFFKPLDEALSEFTDGVDARTAPMLLLWSALIKNLHSERPSDVAVYRGVPVDRQWTLLTIAAVNGSPFDLLLTCTDPQNLASFGAHENCLSLAFKMVENTIIEQLHHFVGFISMSFNLEDDALEEQLVLLLTALFRRRQRFDNSSSPNTTNTSTPVAAQVSSFADTVHSIFWKEQAGRATESIVPSGVSRIFDYARGRFPHRISLFLDLVVELSGQGLHTNTNNNGVDDTGVQFRENVLLYLQDLQHFCRADIERLSYSSFGFQSQMLQLQQPLPAIIAFAREGAGSHAMFHIPKRTQGQVIGNGDDESTSIIQWHYQYSAWCYIHLHLDNLLQSFRINQVVSMQQQKDAVSMVRLIGCIYGSTSLSNALEAHVMIAREFLSPTMRRELENAQRPLLAQVLLLLKSSSKLSPMPTELAAACMECIAIAAHTATDFLITYFVSFEAFTGSPGGFVDTVLDTIVHFERREGKYGITLASLKLTNTLVLHLIQHEPLQDDSSVLCKEMLRLVRSVADVLVDFNSFQNERFSEKYEIGQLILSIFNHILNVDLTKFRPILQTLRQQMQYHIHDTILGKALLKIVAKGYQNVEGLYSNGQETSAKGWTRLVELSLGALLATLQNETTFPTRSSLSELQKNLLGDVAEDYATGNGYHNMVTEIASYLKHTRTNELPVLATKILTEICKFAGSQSVAGCLGPAPDSDGYQGTSKQEMLQVIFAKRVEEKSPWELRVAILECIKEAVLSQPGLAKLFLDIRSTTTNDDGANQRSPKFGEKSCMHEVLLILRDQEKSGWLARHPEVPAAAAALIHALWTMSTTEVFRSQPHFWEHFTAPLLFKKQTTLSTPQDFTRWHYQTLAQASVLEVLTLEAFYTKGNVNQSAEGPHAAMLKVCKNVGIDTLCPTTYVNNDKFASAQSRLVQAWRKLIVVATKHTTSRPTKVQIKPCFGIKESMSLEKLGLFIAKATAKLISHVYDQPNSVDAETVSGSADVDSTRVCQAHDAKKATREYTSMVVEMADVLLVLLQRSVGSGLKPDDVQTLVQAIVQTLERIAPLGVEMDSVWVNMCCSLLHSFQLFNPNFSGLVDTLYKTIEIVWTRLDVWFKARDVTEREVVAGDVTDPNIASTSLALMELLIPKITPSRLRESVVFRNGLLEIMFERFSKDMGLWQDLPFVQRIIHFGLMIVGTGPENAALALCRSASHFGRVNGLVLHLTQGAVEMIQAVHSTGGKGLPSYTAADERNPWHVVWCDSLSLMSAVTRTLKHRNGMLHDVLTFTTVHIHRIEAALSMFEVTAGSPGTTVVPKSLGDLEETMAIVTLLAELSHHSDFLQRVPNVLEHGGVLHHVVKLFAACVDTLGTDQRLHERVKAVSADEQRDAKGDSKSSRFYSNVTDVILAICQVSLVLMRNLTLPRTVMWEHPKPPQPITTSPGKRASKRVALSTKMCATDLVATRQLFMSELVHVSSQATIYTLIEFMEVCAKISDNKDRRPSDSEHRLLVSKSQLHTAVEQTVIVLISQVALLLATWKSRDLHRTLLKACACINSSFCGPRESLLQVSSPGLEKMEALRVMTEDQGQGVFKLLHQFTAWQERKASQGNPNIRSGGR